MKNPLKLETVQQFDLNGEVISCESYGNGHINDTFLLRLKEGEQEKKIIVQRLNHVIFKQPEELMENILGVTAHLRRKIEEEGGDPERETLNVILTKAGKPFYKDSSGNYWRAYRFIEGATCYDTVKKPEDFYESAVAFGHFQKLLADYPAATLHETIAGFHDTKARFRRFEEVVKEDKCQRAAGVKKEIDFVLSRFETAEVLGKLQAEGKLPLRVTHNDTKLNNIMIDNKTGKAICVIDLDTVMPGLAINDFGDSIRFGASTGEEDEKELSRIACDLSLFETYTKGFIKGCEGRLTLEEMKLLPMGAKVMTFECGMRFLTDYLEGDVYFKIHRKEHNLDRARTQFKLVEDMEAKWSRMLEIVNACLQEAGCDAKGQR